MVKLAIALLLAIATAGACTLLDEDPPDGTCSTDNDCFRAQGERCNQMTKRCEMRSTMDAGVDTP